MDDSNASETSPLACFPFRTFLQTDYTPTKEEIKRVKEYLQKSEAQSKENEKKIERLYEEIEAAEAESRRIQAHIDACSSIISLARHIPDDLLREIFCRCLPADGNAVLNVNTAPLSLTMVCSHWRQIALTTPTLWSTIHIPIVPEEIDGRLFTRTSPMTQEQAFERAVERAIFVSQWLERSGSTPLSISLSVSYDQYYGGRVFVLPEFVDEYIKAIKPFSTRWRTIRLNGQYRDYEGPEGLDSLSADDVPILESLSLDLKNGNRFRHVEGNAWSHCGLLSASSLTKLRIQDANVDLTSVDIRWQSLTQLALGFSYNHTPDLATLSRILRQCTSLIDCRLSLENESWPGNENTLPDNSAMYMPSLKKLALREGPNTLLPLIAKLEVPCLEEITFESTLESSEAVIKTLVSHANENLRKISLKMVCLDASAFREILHHSPNLTSLSLMQCSNQPSPELQFDDELLKQLASPDGPSLCPGLEKIDCDFEAEFTCQGFLDFVTRKQSGTDGQLAKLKEVFIHPVSERDQKTGRMEYQFIPDLDMKPFVDDGLSFCESINYEDNSSIPTAIFTAYEGWRPYDNGE